MKLTDATLLPAYGRDYKSKKKVEEDFTSGKDFRAVYLNVESYCSIRDFQPGDRVKIRYDKSRKVVYLTV